MDFEVYMTEAKLADAVGGDALCFADLDNFHPEDGMILVNTTSVGMHPKIDQTPVPKHALGFYSLVFDAAYEQFERFTGLPAPKELFRKVMDNSY
ncbi:hypothetical protein M0R45_005402 [Rubus argutus]|uniref:Uncharacterized protein n=1 Tax=Rubus argutus TaxID=59490 RepID=A0AAW1YMK9_RUBAR